MEGDVRIVMLLLVMINGGAMGCSDWNCMLRAKREDSTNGIGLNRVSGVQGIWSAQLGENSRNHDIGTFVLGHILEDRSCHHSGSHIFQIRFLSGDSIRFPTGRHWRFGGLRAWGRHSQC